MAGTNTTNPPDPLTKLLGLAVVGGIVWFIFFRKSGKAIAPLTVKDILEEQIARKLV